MNEDGELFPDADDDAHMLAAQETEIHFEARGLPSDGSSASKRRGTTTEAAQQLARDWSDVDAGVGTAHLDTRAPVRFSLRLGPNGHGVHTSKDGFMLVPVTNNNEDSAWFSTMETLTSRFLQGTLGEQVVNTGKTAATAAAAEPPKTQINFAARRSANIQGRLQKGEGWEALLCDICKAARN
jgi:hypothetical protein